MPYILKFYNLHVDVLDVGDLCEDFLHVDVLLVDVLYVVVLHVELLMSCMSMSCMLLKDLSTLSLEECESLVPRGPGGWRKIRHAE